MMRITKSRARKEKTPARAEGEREAERYSGAFERVRLVRAWIAVAVAVVAMLSGYVALLERLVRWWSSLPRRLPARIAVVVAAMSWIGALGPAQVMAYAPGPPLRAHPPDATFAPVVDVSPHLGDRRDVSQCVADCFESVFSYTTPAYISRDTPRSLSLIYRSGRAKPYGKVTLDVTDAQAASFRLQLVTAGGNGITFSNGSQSMYFAKSATGPTRIAAEFDASAMPTSASLYSAIVTAVNADGTLGASNNAWIRIIVINDQASPYGAGVEVGGVQQLFIQTDGVLVTDASGSATFYTGTCSPWNVCTFTAPAGEFATLTTANGNYRRTYPDGTVVTFSTAGLQTTVIDRFNNTNQYWWAWNADDNQNVLTNVIDPTNQSMGLYYRVASTADGDRIGSLGRIDAPGDRHAYVGIRPTSNDLRTIVDFDGLAYATFVTDAQHRLYSVQDKKGGTTYFYYGHGSTLSGIASRLSPSRVERPALRRAPTGLLGTRSSEPPPLAWARRTPPRSRRSAMHARS